MKELMLAAEIGGTKLQIALGTPQGAIVERIKGQSPASEGADAVLAWFNEQIPHLLRRAGAAGACVVGMGVGFGGPVESATGRVLVSHQVNGWENIALKAWFEDRFSLPVTISNDSNAAGWAEYCLGAGRGARQFFYMNVGSGIGGALVIDGKLYDGQGRGAAEIGHTYVTDWTAPLPGAIAKLEDLCSGWSIERRARRSAPPVEGTPLHKLWSRNQQRITCAILAEAARRGDPRAAAEMGRIAESIAIAISNVLALFHPENIVVGGGLSLVGDVLFTPLRDAVARYVFGPYRDRYKILPSELGEDVVLAGGQQQSGPQRPA
ncbi:MAG TPA: ROK family protein, partial [Candidatus Hydrogenedentes bacterium]|nr:ROK family protein [Candidatus Hydrogenedentota bacterium]